MKEHITQYIIGSGAFLLLLGLVWNRDTLINVTVKFACILFAIWALILLISGA